MTRSWGDITRLFAQLWPDWKPTPAQQTEFRDRLETKNLAWVESCVRDHYSMDCPKDGVFISPRLSQLLRRYANIAESGEAKEFSHRRAVTYRAAWVGKVNGQPYAYGSRETFATPAQALRHAEEHGERCSAVPVGEASGEFDWDEVMADDRKMRNDILRWPADRVERAVIHALDLDVLGITRASVAGEVMDWKRFVVGVIWSVDEKLRKANRGAK